MILAHNGVKGKELYIARALASLIYVIPAAALRRSQENMLKPARQPYPQCFHYTESKSTTTLLDYYRSSKIVSFKAPFCPRS